MQAGSGDVRPRHHLHEIPCIGAALSGPQFKHPRVHARIVPVDCGITLKYDPHMLLRESSTFPVDRGPVWIIRRSDDAPPWVHWGNAEAEVGGTPTMVVPGFELNMIAAHPGGGLQEMILVDGTRVVFTSGEYVVDRVNGVGDITFRWCGVWRPEPPTPAEIIGLAAHRILDIS